MPSSHRPLEFLDSPLLSRISQSSPITSNIPSALRSPSVSFNSSPPCKRPKSLLKRSSKQILSKDACLTFVPLSSPALSHTSSSSEEEAEENEDDCENEDESDQMKSLFFKSPIPPSKKQCTSSLFTPSSHSSSGLFSLSPCLQTPLSQCHSVSKESTPCKLNSSSLFSFSPSPQFSHAKSPSKATRRSLFSSQSFSSHHALKANQEIKNPVFTPVSNSSSLSLPISSSFSPFSSPFLFSSPSEYLVEKSKPRLLSSSTSLQRPRPLLNKFLPLPSFIIPRSLFDSEEKNMESSNKDDSNCSSACLPFTSHRKLKLPSTFSSSDGIPRISSATLVKAMQGAIDGIEKVHIIDCRFPFEYRGGHIQDATNINSFEELDHLFLTDLMPSCTTAIVFHCEFSSHRGPLMAQHLRRQDRSLNSKHYPSLYYPEIYILEGGYKQFYTNHQDLCFPQGYVRMDDKLYTDECKVEHLNRKYSLMRSKSSSMKWE